MVVQARASSDNGIESVTTSSSSWEPSRLRNAGPESTALQRRRRASARRRQAERSAWGRRRRAMTNARLCGSGTSADDTMKFWLAITAEEQLKRFKEREKTRFKRFKITAEDWRNREKSAEYHAAVCDMVDRTSTSTAPWTLVEANDKSFARVKILRTICERIERALNLDKPQEKAKEK